jgi:hypothetical protein
VPCAEYVSWFTFLRFFDRSRATDAPKKRRGHRAVATDENSRHGRLPGRGRPHKLELPSMAERVGQGHAYAQIGVERKHGNAAGDWTLRRASHVSSFARGRAKLETEARRELAHSKISEKVPQRGRRTIGRSCLADRSECGEIPLLLSHQRGRSELTQGLNIKDQILDLRAGQRRYPAVRMR